MLIGPPAVYFTAGGLFFGYLVKAVLYKKAFSKYIMLLLYKYAREKRKKHA